MCLQDPLSVMGFVSFSVSLFFCPGPCRSLSFCLCPLLKAIAVPEVGNDLQIFLENAKKPRNYAVFLVEILYFCTQGNSFCRGAKLQIVPEKVQNSYAILHRDAEFFAPPPPCPPAGQGRSFFVKSRMKKVRRLYGKGIFRGSQRLSRKGVFPRFPRTVRKRRFSAVPGDCTGKAFFRDSRGLYGKDVSPRFPETVRERRFSGGCGNCPGENPGKIRDDPVRPLPPSPGYRG